LVSPLRYADIALLLIPVALLAAWIAGVRGLSPRGIGVILGTLGVLALLLVWLGQERGFTGHYEPAHLDQGRVAPGHPG